MHTEERTILQRIEQHHRQTKSTGHQAFSTPMESFQSSCMQSMLPPVFDPTPSSCSGRHETRSGHLERNAKATGDRNHRSCVEDRLFGSEASKRVRAFPPHDQEQATSTPQHLTIADRHNKILWGVRCRGYCESRVRACLGFVTRNSHITVLWPEWGSVGGVYPPEPRRSFNEGSQIIGEMPSVTRYHRLGQTSLLRIISDIHAVTGKVEARTQGCAALCTAGTLTEMLAKIH